MTKLIKTRIMTSAASVLTALALTTAFGATPAHAVTSNGACSTSGGFGGVTVDHPPGATDYVPRVVLYVSDSARDGAHMRVRLVTENHEGKNKYWPWRKLTSGFNNTKDWVTSAKESSGIFHVGVQVARYDGNTYLNHCSDWAY